LFFLGVGHSLTLFSSVFCAGYFLSTRAQLRQGCTNLVLNFFFGRLFFLEPLRLCTAYWLLAANSRIAGCRNALPWPFALAIFLARIGRCNRLVLSLFLLGRQFDPVYNLQPLQLVGTGLDQLLLRLFFSRCRFCFRFRRRLFGRLGFLFFFGFVIVLVTGLVACVLRLAPFALVGLRLFFSDNILRAEVFDHDALFLFPPLFGQFGLGLDDYVVGVFGANGESRRFALFRG